MQKCKKMMSLAGNVPKGAPHQLPTENPMGVVQWIESALSWVCAYPLLPLQLVLVVLVAWGRLGYGVGSDDLFWSEWPLEQFLNGLACGLLFGEVLLVRYLLDPDQGQFSSLPATLFPVADPAVRDLGRFLALFWAASLLVLWGGKLFSPDVRGGEVGVWPFLVGLVASVVMVAAGVVFGLRFGPAPVMTADPLHGAAAVAAGLFALAVAGLYAAHFAGATLPPVAVVCLLLGLANAAYGFLAFRMPGSQYVALLLLVGAGLLANSRLVGGLPEYRLTLPGLEDQYANPQRLDEEPKEGGMRKDHYFELLADRTKGGAAVPDLIPSDLPLIELKKRWQAEHPDGSKPRIVLVCTSGGGIRAAVWTAVVLEGLEKAMPAGFRDHIRLIAGASGGMVGAGLYAANFERGPFLPPADPRNDLGPLSGPLARDSLRRTVQTMALVDQPALFWPGPVGWDRGREIERVWADNTAGLGGGKAQAGSPFQRSFADLAALEREGRRPSLIFSPMLVEDARRLLVSNLDLLDLTWTSANVGVAGFKPFRESYKVPAGPARPLLSISAVELFRLFPDARARFEVGTAARMNASFPLVGPGVSLPTHPARRVVDAGYYDNFGVNLAAMWLLRNEAAIREHTSGVAVIEVRAYRNWYARWHFQNQEAEKLDPDPTRRGVGKHRRDKDALAAALEWLSTPVEAINNARGRAAYYRNDELLDLLDAHFREKAGDGFFTTLAFECEVDAALSWTLPTREALRITRAYHGNPDAEDPKGGKKPEWIRAREKGLEDWFGNGGR